MATATIDDHLDPAGKAGDQSMLQWALIFVVVALIAGGLRFGGIVSASAGIAKAVMLIIRSLFGAGLISRKMRGRACVGSLVA